MPEPKRDPRINAQGGLTRGLGTIRDNPYLYRYVQDLGAGMDVDPYRGMTSKDADQRKLLEALIRSMVLQGGRQQMAPPQPTPVPTPGSTFSNITNPGAKDALTRSQELQR